MKHWRRSTLSMLLLLLSLEPSAAQLGVDAESTTNPGRITGPPTLPDPPLTQVLIQASKPPGPEPIGGSNGPSPASAQDAAPATSPYLGKDFRTIESGLDDCHIPFDALQTQAASCAQGAALIDGRRCEMSSPSQFPEVVKIYIPKTAQAHMCTGILVAPDWVLTAAHCFVGERPVSTLAGKAGADYVLDNQAADLKIYAQNAITLTPKEATAFATSVIVHGGYTGVTNAGPPYMQNDLALIKLGQPYPLSAIEPGQIAAEQLTNGPLTVAGYGFTNADGGKSGQFNVSWPANFSDIGNQLSLSGDNGQIQKSGGICQGDSGGPAFSGRARGCPASSGEMRPRQVLGTTSYNYAKNDLANLTAAEKAQLCLTTKEMVLQDITDTDVRNWICTRTGNKVGGCTAN